MNAFLQSRLRKYAWDSREGMPSQTYTDTALQSNVQNFWNNVKASRAGNPNANSGMGDSKQYWSPTPPTSAPFTQPTNLIVSSGLGVAKPNMEQYNDPTSRSSQLRQVNPKLPDRPVYSSIPASDNNQPSRLSNYGLEIQRTYNRYRPNLRPNLGYRIFNGTRNFGNTMLGKVRAAGNTQITG